MSWGEISLVCRTTEQKLKQLLSLSVIKAAYWSWDFNSALDAQPIQVTQDKTLLGNFIR